MSRGPTIEIRHRKKNRVDVSFSRDDPFSMIAAIYTIDIADRTGILTKQEANDSRKHIRVYGNQASLKKRLDASGSSNHFYAAGEIRAMAISREIGLDEAQARFREIHSNYLTDQRQSYREAI